MVENFLTGGRSNSTDAKLFSIEQNANLLKLCHYFYFECLFLKRFQCVIALYFLCLSVEKNVT